MRTTIESIQDVKALVAFLLKKEEESIHEKTKLAEARKKGRIEGIEMVIRVLEGVRIEAR